MTMTLRAYQTTPIPRHILGANGVMTPISKAPLTKEWARAFAAQEHTVQLRPVDIVDVTGNYPRAFSDQLDLEEDRERALTTYHMWVVSRSHPSFKAAEAQLYHIGHLAEATASLSRSRYLLKAEQLRREGYTQHAIDSVPMPPPDVPAIHWDTDCRNELRKGSLNTDVLPGWTIPYCPRCGWVQQAEWRPRHPRQVEDLQDRGPLLLPPNPDAIAISEDPEGEGPAPCRACSPGSTLTFCSHVHLTYRSHNYTRRLAPSIPYVFGLLFSLLFERSFSCLNLLPSSPHALSPPFLSLPISSPPRKKVIMEFSRL